MKNEYDLLDNVVKIHHYLSLISFEAIEYSREGKKLTQQSVEVKSIFELIGYLQNYEIRAEEILPSKLAPRKNDIKYLFKEYCLPSDPNFYKTLSKETQITLKKLECEGENWAGEVFHVFRLQCFYMNYFLPRIYKSAGLSKAEAEETPVQEKQVEKSVNPQPEEKQKAEENGRKYSEDLLKLFHSHVEELDSLVGLSDSKIADRINKLAKERDKFGKPKIENPGNYGNKSAYAQALKDNGLINCSVGTFRRLL